MDNYKNKYLKYKNKYLDLKTRLTGGADCPTFGFYQHHGECWHDALSMILLYSDALSDNIQAMFGSEHFSTSNIIYQAITNQQLQFLLPKNIESVEDLVEDGVLFNVETYISELRSRYLNDKLPIKRDRNLFGKIFDYTKGYISQLQSRYLSDKLPIEPEDIKLFRQNSIGETMMCTDIIFNIADININIADINIKESYKRLDQFGHRSGNILHTITVISLFNYFLLNYLPEQLGPVRELKFINMNILNINPLNLFYTKDRKDQLTKKEKKKVLYILHNSLLKLIEKLDICIGICVTLSNRDELDIKQQLVRHAVAFIKCNDKLFFYDDNGVLNDEPDVEINDDVEFRNTSPTLLIEFDWIKYLKQKIEEIKTKFIKLIHLNSLDVEIELSHILEVILDFSEFINIQKYGFINIQNYGRRYLENYFISELKIITLENLSTEEHYNETIKDINLIYKEYYTNPRSQ